MRVDVQNKTFDIKNYVNFCKAAAITMIAFWHYYYVLTYGDSLDLLKTGGIAGTLEKFPVSGFFGGMESLFMTILGLGGYLARFFIIASGFGLYLSYLRRKDKWSVFYKKRAVRILPLYWAAVVLIYVFHKYDVPGNEASKVFIYHLLLVQTYTKYSLAYGALWFVGYIAQLYLLFPVIVKFFKTRGSKILLIIFSLFGNIVVAKIVTAAGFEPQGKPPTEYLVCFVFGMLLAEGMYGQKDYFKKMFSPIYLPVFITCAALLIFFLNNYGFFYGDVSTNLFLILLFLILYWPFRIAAAVLPAFLDISKTLSYGSFVVFLSHQSLNGVFLEFLLRHRLAKYAIYGGSIVQVPSLENALLEVPIFIITFLISLSVQAGYDYISGGALKRLDNHR